MYSRFTPFGYTVRRFLLKAFGLVLGVMTLSGLVYALNQSSGARPAPYSLPVTPEHFEIQSTLAPARSEVPAASQTLFSPGVHDVDAPSPQPEVIPTVASNPLPDPYPYQERSREYRPPRPHYSYTRTRETSGLETHTRGTHTLPTRTLPTEERETPPPRRYKEPRSPRKAKNASEDQPKPDRHHPPSEKDREKTRDKKHDSSR